MKRMFQEFTDLLADRVQRNVSTTEDALRYTFFFAACTSLHIGPSDIILEDPYSPGQRTRTDLRLKLRDGTWTAAEFKFHRALRGGGPRPRPQQAGTIVADMYRLRRCRAARQKIMVYLTDQEMAHYMRNNNDTRLRDLFDTPTTGLRLTPTFFDGMCPTFLRASGRGTRCVVHAVWAKALPSRYELRIWEVR